jgi:hypothetical protein
MAWFFLFPGNSFRQPAAAKADPLPKGMLMLSCGGMKEIS